jgi:hypothetical protein
MLETEVYTINLELGSAITVTPEGDIFVTGRSLSTNMNVTRAYQDEYAGGEDGFLLNIRGSDHTIEFSTYIGGTHPDAGWNLVVDSSGRPLILGWTQSSNFPSDDSFKGGISDVFLCRFSTSDITPTDTSI